MKIYCWNYWPISKTAKVFRFSDNEFIKTLRILDNNSIVFVVYKLIPKNQSMNKKLFLYTALAVMLFVSCKTSKISDVQSTKGTADQQKMINGPWILNTVTYEGNEGKFSSVLFNDADASCFENSEWYFRNNNNTGSYIIAGSENCSEGERFMRWSILSTGQLQFKAIDSKYKDISGGLGYRLDIASLDASQMVLKSRVSVDGEPITIVYSFTKNQ